MISMAYFPSFLGNKVRNSLRIYELPLGNLGKRKQKKELGKEFPCLCTVLVLLINNKSDFHISLLHQFLLDNN